MTHDQAYSSARERFIERFALSMEREGMPRIAGRIYALLLLEAKAFTFEELAERLRVSRGSVSTNTRTLESGGLIERITVPGERRTRYQLVGEPFTPLLTAAVERLHERQRIAQELLSREGGDVEVVARLSDLTDFQALAIDALAQLTTSWKDRDDS